MTRLRKRSRKFAGTRSHGTGNAKNRRGKGSRGGVGRAGFHKHKRLHYLKVEGTSTTMPGFVNVTGSKIEAIGLNEIQRRIDRGIYKPEGGMFRIDLRKKGKYVKLLGNGEIASKAEIMANFYSASAKERVEKAGGKIGAVGDIKTPNGSDAPKKAA